MARPRAAARSSARRCAAAPRSRRPRRRARRARARPRAASPSAGTTRSRSARWTAGLSVSGSSSVPTRPRGPQLVAAAEPSGAASSPSHERAPSTPTAPPTRRAAVRSRAWIGPSPSRSARRRGGEVGLLAAQLADADPRARAVRPPRSRRPRPRGSQQRVPVLAVGDREAPRRGDLEPVVGQGAEQRGGDPQPSPRSPRRRARRAGRRRRARRPARRRAGRRAARSPATMAAAAAAKPGPRSRALVAELRSDAAASDSLRRAGRAQSGAARRARASCD